MIEEVQYSLAEPADEGEIRNLLTEAQLPSEDIAGHLKNFVVANAAGHLIGVIGLEACGAVGLLRSLAVAPAWRRRGIAKALYDRLLARAHLLGLTELYLLTLTATGYFAKLGFQEIERAGVPASIQATREFQGLCPQTATGMVRQLSQLPRYFPREMLTLRQDVPGARQWAVSLEQTMLTCFEVEPHSRFEAHRHESEQITLVLTGELYFEMDGETVRVGTGEVIAIPSGVPHAAYTLEQAVRAVDAWSPVMARYAASQDLE